MLPTKGSPVLDRQTTLSPDEARSLTEKIKARSEELWHLLLEAYERGAHTALGYDSWGAYFEAEYGGSKSRAYQLIDAGRVVKAIEGHSATVESAESTNVERDDSPNGERAKTKIPNEHVARQLSPLTKEDPKTAGHVLNELVEEYGDELTGAHTKKAVSDVFEATAIREKLPPKTKAAVESTPPDCSMPRNPAQMKQLQNIANKRGDERAADTAERVGNGEFKSTFEAYPEVKEDAAKPEPTMGDLMERAGVSMDDAPRRSEENKALYQTWQAILKVADPMTENLDEGIPEVKQFAELRDDAISARNRLSALIGKLERQDKNRLRGVPVQAVKEDR